MIKHFLNIILFLSFALLQAQSFSQTFGQNSNPNLSIKSELDTNLIKIGEQVKLSVDVQYPQGADIFFPILQDTITKEIEIVELSFDTVISDENIFHYVANYTLTSFDSGYYVIPPQILIDKQSGDTFVGNPLVLAVVTFSIDSASQGKIFDIKAPVEAPWTLKEFLSENYPFLLGGALIIALIFVLLWYLRQRKKKTVIPVKKIVPKEAAHVIALRNLDELKTKKLWQNDRTKMYYVELSDIVRNYLENRYRIKALEQTSDEIFTVMEHGQFFSPEQSAQLKQILSTADMAKFAKAQPLSHENDLALKYAFELVQATKMLEAVKIDTESQVKVASEIKQPESNQIENKPEEEVNRA